MTCERCWGDARQLASDVGGAHQDWYHVLLAEGREHPCSPREQAGPFWDADRQVDRRRHEDVEMALGPADHRESV